MQLGKFTLKILFLSFFLFLSYVVSVAQDIPHNPKNHYTVGGNVFTGFIIKHSEKMGHLSNTHPTGFEVFINKHTFGPNFWHQRYNFPDIGFSISYFDSHNEILGKYVAATSYMDFNVRRRKNSDLIIKIGTGLVYTTNPYDLIENPKNNAISNWISWVLQSRVGYNVRLNDYFKLNTGLTLTHFSNGGYKLPNSGINIVTYNVGISHTLHHYQPSYNLVTELPDLESGYKFNMVLFTGLKGLPNEGGRFPFINLSAYMDKRISYTSAVNLGIDGFYNTALKNGQKADSSQDPENSQDFKRAGMVAGHELFMGNLSLLTQFGVYFYKPLKVDSPVYQRYGLKYYFNGPYFAALNLKSHGGRADVIEWGLGVRI